MADPYPNECANTIYSHLRSLSNTIGDFGDTVASLQLSTILPGSSDHTMPSFNRPGSIRRRFLRIISFGRYSSGSADDTEPLTRALDSSRRHSAPADMDAQSTNRPTYAAHQSPQSSDSAQTTIIHEVPGAAPFSISAFHDQQRGHHISDTEFDTPPSLEAAQETTHADQITRPLHPTRPVTTTYPGAPWNTAWNPARLHRDKSYLQCNVCNRVLEYHQIHCPGCAARTFHHVPVPIEESHTDSRDRGIEPRSLQPKKGRQNEQHDVMTEESSWNTQGLEAGTADESWTTTAGDVVDFAPPKITVQESTSQSAETNEPQSEQPDTVCLHIHCCCGTSKTHNHASAQCTNTYTLRLRRHTAAVVFVHSNPGNGACRHGRRGHARDNHICCRIWDGEHADITDEASQGCMCGKDKQGGVTEKTAWWMRWSKWFCCC
jgi:hypothetical protein